MHAVPSTEEGTILQAGLYRWWMPIMDLHSQPKWTIAAVVLAGGALLMSAIIPWSRDHAAFDGAAFAARGSVSPGRQGKAATPAEVDHPAVAPEGNAEALTWSDAEIIAGLEECVRLLAPTGAEVEVSKPVRNGQCGAPAPVLLKRIDGVTVSPPAVVNCRLAARLHHWMKETVQPIAEEMLGDRITRIVSASAYACRERIGTTGKRLSEHSLANALDISAFVTADGRSIDVLTNWGPTARDRQAQAKSAKPAGGDARPLRDAEPVEASSTTNAQFLRRMHEGACATFGTVLGPEANEAHRDHLHVDLAPRKHSAFCE
jgi:hypothetical protein